MHQDAITLNRISERIIGCAFGVMNTLGVGFLEKVYENALAHELRKAGLSVAQQHGITIRYDDIVAENTRPILRPKVLSSLNRRQ
jgi:GxxExxY protein